MKLGFLTFVFSLVFLGCGSSYEEKESSNGGGGLTADQKQFFSKTIKPILTDSCAMAGCHPGAGFVNDPDAFLASAAIARINSTSNPMPIPGTAGDRAFSVNDKNLVLGFPDNAD